MSNPSNEKIALKVDDLVVSYHGNPVIEQLNLAIPEHHLAAIIGPNGAGKSTLLKSALSLVKADSGSVLFWGERFEKQRKRVAYIPQRSTIDFDFPATVTDVVTMGLYVHKGLFGRINADDKKKVRSALETVDLLDFKDRQISKLSGGQQQRVFIARAIVQNPDMYLMDEPFAGVDAASEMRILKILKELVKNKKSILVVHHDLETVKEYFDYMVLINKHHIASGPIESTFTFEHIREAYGSIIPKF